MALYGFGKENASQLLKVARREGQRSRFAVSLGYPEFLDATTPLLGKADASVTGGASVTVSLWGGTPGSETDLGTDIANCYLRYGYVPASAFVVIGWMGGGMYIVGDHRTVVVKADADIAKGASGVCSIYNNDADTGDNITAEARGGDIPAAMNATAWQEEKSGDWLVACWETA